MCGGGGGHLLGICCHQAQGSREPESSNALSGRSPHSLDIDRGSVLGLLDSVTPSSRQLQSGEDWDALLPGPSPLGGAEHSCTCGQPQQHGGA